ncbi:MAG: cation-translocating P-type ATPase [Caulobacteraceae bacterium]
MDSLQGPLTEAEARERLAAEGPNSLPSSGRSGLLTSFVRTLREPMFALLLASGLVYVALGEVRDALVLLVFASVSTAIAMVQDHRSERVLDSLRALGAPMALVRRAEGRRRIPAEEVVRGDLLLVAEGDRVAADGLLVESLELEVDESLLTGESIPVAKAPATDLYSGTLVARGRGVAKVTAIGARAKIGELGAALKAIAAPPTDLVRQSRRLVRGMGLAAILVCLTVVVALGLRHGDWVTGLLGGLAVGMALIPEEVPLVMTVFSVMGAWRIARAGVLARQTSAIEGLGAATVLCTDKTGTLTQNRMAVVRGWRPEAAVVDDHDLSGLARLAALASAEEAADPMERAIFERSGPNPSRPLVQGFGLSPELLATIQVWSLQDGEPAYAAAKGAPEAIARLCGLDPEAHARLSRAADDMAAHGVRVLGLAEGCWEGSAPPSAPGDIAFRLIGLIGLADPIRPEAPPAVAACRRAGVRVIMVTGDHPATARAIAAEAGIAAGAVVAGGELDALSDDQLVEAVRRVSVFARIMPFQKLRLVKALQASGEVVAMMGDGVNDAPALKAADIGIAMGARGSDVAREAAGLVLIHDGFGAVAETIGLGRRIFANLRQALAFIVAVHVPIAGLALAGPLFGGELLLLPLHIALLEVFIDPVCSIAFEAEPAAADLMDRPPRDRSAPLFPAADIVRAVVIGGAGLLLVLAVFAVGRLGHETLEAARGGSFAALVTADVVMVLAVRASNGGMAALRRRNRSMTAMICGAIVILVLGLFTPAGELMLRLSAPSVQALVVILILAPAIVVLGVALHRPPKSAVRPARGRLHLPPEGQA